MTPAAPRRVRIFFSTGEASGDMNAALLAGALRALEPNTEFSGIGGDRMRAAGVRLVAEHRGWAAMGLLEALGKIPKLSLVAWRTVFALIARPVDLIVLIDFGAFNLRFARLLRRFGYRGAMLYYFPPSAWLDREKPAREVARCAHALTAFEHQRDFYARLGLPIAYFGHPLASVVHARAPLPREQARAPVVALLPGSRGAEIARHLPRLLAACELLRASRPALEVLVSVADAASLPLVRSIVDRSGVPGATLVRGAEDPLARADAAFVASGTAVLEAALREVPCVALYVMSQGAARIARRAYRGRFVTLPNLILEREVVPELLQDDATPERLAGALTALLANAEPQLAAYRAVRAALGPADALERCARYALSLAVAA